MKFKRRKESTFDKIIHISSSLSNVESFLHLTFILWTNNSLTLTDLWKICAYFGQNHDRSLIWLPTELPNKKWKKWSGQKLLIVRNSEKQNLRNLVHGALSCTTFKMSTCYLNTLYIYSYFKMKWFQSEVSR